MSLPEPDSERLGAAVYAVPRPAGPIDLWLDGNEGPVPGPELCAELATLEPELLRRYPRAAPLEAELAARHGVPAERVYVTAGADEAIDRFCRAFLAPGKNAVVLTPAFEMQLRYVLLAGAAIREVPWTGGAFPADAVAGAVDADTVCVAIATPNNPTGLVAPIAALRELARRLPDVWCLLDLVYADFLPEDPTPACLALANAIVLRSLSKSGGLAGLRVGYAIGPAGAIGAMRRAGGPYLVAAPSLAVAARFLREPSRFAGYAAQVARERDDLAARLAAGGCRVPPSMANFVLAHTPRAQWLWAGLAALGIAVRWFPDRPGLQDAVRITCPGDAGAAARLGAAVTTTLRPAALLFDIDGVLADIRGLYDAAILATAARFGVAIGHDVIEAAKARGDANNDWRLTRSLLAAHGKPVPLADVTEVFEDLYQSGLWQHETLCVPRDVLAGLARRLPLGIVTGRPRRDAERFLRTHGIDDLFAAVVCMEDGPQKPAPDPVLLALRELDVASAWFLGDTVDDVAAARAAGVLPLGIAAPGCAAGAARTTLLAAGAARVLGAVADLHELLPDPTAEDVEP